MIRKMLVSALIAGMALPALAENTIEELATPILERIQKGEYSGVGSLAFLAGPAASPYLTQNDIKQIDSQLSAFLSAMGKSVGYELYLASSVPGIYEIRYYLFRFERQPVIIRMEFYRPGAAWRIQSLGLDGDLDEKMRQAADRRMGTIAVPDLGEPSKAINRPR